MSIEGPIRTIQDGLVLHFDAGNNKSYPGSGTTWTDISRNGNNGTLTGGPTFSGDNLGAIVLDGTDDTINFTYDLRSNWSFECWVLHSVISGFSFLGQGPTTVNNGLHIWFYDNTSLRFGMYANDSDVLSLTTSTTVWYHYCFTYNHSSPYTKQAFRNGQPLSLTIQNSPATQYSGTGTVRIGATYSSGGSYANGKFSNVKLYNRILSPNEILQNYDAAKSRFGL